MGKNARDSLEHLENMCYEWIFPKPSLHLIVSKALLEAIPTWIPSFRINDSSQLLHVRKLERMGKTLSHPISLQQEVGPLEDRVYERQFGVV